jgi:nickel-dependent lactate racemase
MEAMSKRITLLYGKNGIELDLPDNAAVLQGQHVAALADPRLAVLEALERPIGSPSFASLLAAKKPRTVAITISDITRPVPNKQFLPAILEALNKAGVADSQVAIIVGTGMHRHSTPQELEIVVGAEILSRVEVVDHDAHDASTLVQVCDNPPVCVCRRFVEADFRIVTGYIEPHFMAGFSGGRKGVCPALVDLRTVQRFHGHKTLCHPKADNGVIEGNPCHEISLKVAKIVGVDFLFNVAITRDRQMAGIYCGQLEQAHQAGCRQVAEWTSCPAGGMVAQPFQAVQSGSGVEPPRPQGHGLESPCYQKPARATGYDLVVTCGGGFPLDQTFYQTVKGMCTALPALGANTTMLMVSHCGEGVGSKAYTDLMLAYDNDWRRFLADIAASDDTKLDQWEFQMQARVLERIGMERLLLASDGIPMDTQKRLALTPLSGDGDAQTRAQWAIDQFVTRNPNASVAVIPEGPYTLLR